MAKNWCTLAHQNIPDFKPEILLILKIFVQVAVQNALEDQEKKHMISWIESEVNDEISKIDQDEMIRVCVENLKKQS